MLDWWVMASTPTRFSLFSPTLSQTCAPCWSSRGTWAGGVNVCTNRSCLLRLPVPPMPSARLLGCAFLLATVLAQAPCDSFAVTTDADTTGDFITHMYSSTGPGGCCEACADDSACHGFAESGGNCWLKGGSVNPVAGASGVHAYVQLMPPVPPALPPAPPGPISPPGACSVFSSYAEMDVAGDGSWTPEWNDASRSDTAPGAESSRGDVANCCATCSALSGCLGFAELNGMCYFKGGNVYTTSMPGSAVVAYLLQSVLQPNVPPPPPPPPPSPPPPIAPASPPPPATECLPYIETAELDVHGDQLYGIPAVPDVSACCSNCTATAGCRAFSLFNGHCYLKGGNLWTNSAAGVAVVAYVLPEPPLPPFPPRLLRRRRRRSPRLRQRPRRRRRRRHHRRRRRRRARRHPLPLRPHRRRRPSACLI